MGRSSSAMPGLIAIAALTTAFAADIAPAGAKPVCTQNDRYLIVEKPYKDSVGNSYIVREKDGDAKPACAFRAQKGDFVIGNPNSEDGDPFFLLKLKDQYLFIDSGTGPDRELVIYNLASRGRIYANGYSDEDISFGDSRATFWAASDEKPTKKTCPKLHAIEKDGFTAGIEVEAAFDYASGQVSTGPGRRCVAYQ